MSVTIAFVENPDSRRDVASRKFWESSAIGKGSEEQGEGVKQCKLKEQLWQDCITLHEF